MIVGGPKLSTKELPAARGIWTGLFSWGGVGSIFERIGLLSRGIRLEDVEGSKGSTASGQS